VGGRAAYVDAPVTGSGCAGKWLRMAAGGFACEGYSGITRDLSRKAIRLAGEFPAKTDDPFPFGVGTTSGSPLYARIPTAKEQRAAEPDLDAHLAAWAKARAATPPEKLPPESARPIAAIPELLAAHAPSPLLGGSELHGLLASTAWSGMRLSLLSAFRVEDEGTSRLFYLTSEHYLVPADRVRAARLADFHGVDLGAPGAAGEHLPIAWVRWKPARRYREVGGRMAAVEGDPGLPLQAHVELGEGAKVRDGVTFFPVKNGSSEVTDWVSSNEVTKVDARPRPKEVAADEAWIDVSIAAQSLVLYRGDTPVFATLISSGVDVGGDPETTRATPTGFFHIASKHISYRMAAEEHAPWKDGDKPDPRYRIDDVPYVQYFQNGYALHAAYWHDSFGQPKSHGCINLSPRDALYLFDKTEPKLPEGWHGVYGGRAGQHVGTVLVVRKF
jgi:lipoprotein-anchoring transpeptidase ErfK/SrfK